MEEGLSTALTFLAYTCVILFTVLTVFIIMLLKDVMEMVKSYTKLSDTVQQEINPALEEIKKALEGINNLATGVDKQMTAVKNSFTSAYNVAFSATSKLKGVIIALAGGLITGFKFFSKRKK